MVNHTRKGNRKHKTKRNSNGNSFVPPPPTTTPSPWSIVPSLQSKTPESPPYPPPFPRNTPTGKQLPLPPNGGFLRDTKPYSTSFAQALSTSYEGFVWDDPSTLTATSDTTKTKKETEETEERIEVEHSQIEHALEQMENEGLFRTDVTQPFSLGTKCAKTYVTRCLLGEEGTTYKYLGLRMFAHPWNIPPKQHPHTVTTLETSLTTIQSLNRFLTRRTTHHLQTLNHQRNQRQLYPKDPPESLVRGRAGFDVALINRMEFTPELKKEPTTGDGRCSVSWHADSCLEHYSTIAVYHTVLSKNNRTNRKNRTHGEERIDKRWSVGLRVVCDSEGPTAGNTGSSSSSSVRAEAKKEADQSPPIAVSLPSGAVYYLLDDFNHHHQHAVMVTDENGDGNNIGGDGGGGEEPSRSHTHTKPKTRKKPKTKQSITTITTDQTSNNTVAGVRYSSTHRLLREGHNVHFVLERCRVVCSQFHKKSPKLWRSEQLLLSDIESEWIRQFYVQGSGHKGNLWKYWKDPICALLQYWTRLETRTKQILDLLRLAAEQRCPITPPSPPPAAVEERTTTTMVPTRAERKTKERRKKALAAIDDILNRGDDDRSNKRKHNGTNGMSDNRVLRGGGGKNALEYIYLPFVTLLRERAKIRKLWIERENDRVFRTMGREYQPIPVPFRFNVGVPLDRNGGGDTKSKKANNNDGNMEEEIGRSPIDGTPEGLGKLGDEIVRYGNAFVSCRQEDLPKKPSGGYTVPTVLKIGSSSSSSPATILRRQSHEDGTKPFSEEMNKEKDATNVTSSWNGWEDQCVYGLVTRRARSSALLNGTKTIEVRSYNLPSALIGRRIMILVTKDNERGKLEEAKEEEENNDGMDGAMLDKDLETNNVTAFNIVGWVVFDRVIQFDSDSTFEADETKCLQPKQRSITKWNDTDKNIVYGWVVSNYGTDVTNQTRVRSIVRRMHSLYEIRSDSNETTSFRRDANTVDGRQLSVGTTKTIGKEKEYKHRKKKRLRDNTRVGSKKKRRY